MFQVLKQIFEFNFEDIKKRYLSCESFINYTLQRNGKNPMPPNKQALINFINAIFFLVLI